MKNNSWINEVKEMELHFTNDEGGTMMIKTKCTTAEVLDRVFFWLDRGWFLDTEELIRRGY